MTTAVIYARLSAVGNDPDNVPKQLDKGREFCEANGYVCDGCRGTVRCGEGTAV